MCAMNAVSNARYWKLCPLKVGHAGLLPFLPLMALSSCGESFTLASKRPCGMAVVSLRNGRGKSDASISLKAKLPDNIFSLTGFVHKV